MQGGVRTFGTDLFGSAKYKRKVSDGALSSGFGQNAFRLKSRCPTKPLKDCLVQWFPKRAPQGESRVITRGVRVEGEKTEREN